MRQSHEKRLRALEERASLDGAGYVFFEWKETEDGEVVEYVDLYSRRRWTPEEFDALIESKPDTVFAPLMAPTPRMVAEAEAYWAEKEAAAPTLQEMMAQNAAVAAGVSWADEGAQEEEADTREHTMIEDGVAATGEAGAEPTRAELARRFEENWEAAEPFWEEMKERAARLSGKG